MLNISVVSYIYNTLTSQKPNNIIRCKLLTLWHARKVGRKHIHVSLATSLCTQLHSNIEDIFLIKKNSIKLSIFKSIIYK